MSDGKVHSKIGASSYYRWKACPGSVRLCKDIPNVSSSYAEEGTLAHEIAASILETGGFPDDIGPVEPEMLEAITTYVDEVNWNVSRFKNAQIWIEHKFDLSEVHPGLYGTADCVVYDPQSKTLYVYDYKHGAGIPVEVQHNDQLMYYGLGALLSLELAVKNVILKIAQPRCYHPDGPIREWSFTPFEILEYAADLKENAVKTENENAPINPGDHCRFCPASPSCPALHTKALEVAKNEFKKEISYDPHKLSDTLKWLDVLDSWSKSVRDFAYREAEAGRVPPNWKLVNKRASRDWVSVDTLKKDLENAFGLKDIYQDPKVKSPAQIEKLLKKDQKVMLEKFVVKESSGYALVPEDDKRESIGLSVKNEFTAITSR